MSGKASVRIALESNLAAAAPVPCHPLLPPGPSAANGGLKPSAPGRLRLVKYTSFASQPSPKRHRALLGLEGTDARLTIPHQAHAEAAHVRGHTRALMHAAGPMLPSVGPKVASAIARNAKRDKYLWGGYYKVAADWDKITSSSPASVSMGVACAGCKRNDPKKGKLLSSNVRMTLS